MQEQEKMERPEAVSKGLTKYFTGRACKHGHITHRYTYSGNCSKCASKRSSNYGKLLKAARLGVGRTEYKRVVRPHLVDILDAVIAADKLTPRPCPNSCPPGTFCMVCDPNI